MRRPPLVLLGISGLFWAATVYTVVLPLLRDRSQRGNYLGGWYGVEEVYRGVPLLAVSLALVVLWLVPRGRRGVAAMRAGMLLTSTVGTVMVLDVVFALGVAGAITPNYWLDSAHISRLDNVPDAELGFRRRGETRWVGYVAAVDRVVEYATDADGFRNEAGSDSAELVFVGDSYTEAAQVEVDHTFVARVGELTGRTVRNLGRGAYGPQQELVVLQRYVLPMEPAPKVVVWQLFDGNDLEDAAQFARWRDDPDLPVASLQERYLANSFFRRWLDETYRDKRGDYARLLRDDGSELPITVRYPWRPAQRTERESAWQATADSLTQGVTACRERGIRVVVLFLPVAAEILAERISFVDPTARERYLPDTGPGATFATAVADLCTDLAVPCVDMTPLFRQAVTSGRADGLYLPKDEHLDLRGHELVAGAIAATLQ